MTLRDACLPIFEGARALLADVGLRRFDVMMRVVEWSGTDIGEGTKTVTDTPLLVQGNRPGVCHVSQKDIIASGGVWEEHDMQIGPFTPRFSGASGPITSGGLEPPDFNPPADGTSREVYYKITGPGLENGAWFTKIGEKTTAFSYVFTVRKIATEAP